MIHTIWVNLKNMLNKRSLTQKKHILFDPIYIEVLEDAKPITGGKKRKSGCLWSLNGSGLLGAMAMFLISARALVRQAYAFVKT